MNSSAPSRLRDLLRRRDCVMAPGVADALGARLVVRAGFDLVYMTGLGTSITRLGMTDIGLLTASEMIDNAARIVDASGLPTIADADTGYGNAMNVRRTIRDFEKAGVAGVHLEDQSLPKRCGHFEGKLLVPTDEMIGKIHAACDARRDEQFTVIARTDAISVEGFEAALDRAHRYHEAGADALFIEAPVNQSQVEQIGSAFPDVPLLYNMSSSGKTPDLSAAELTALGFRIAIYPNWMLLAAVLTMENVLAELKSTGSVAGLRQKVATFRYFNEIAGLSEIQELENRYRV